MKIRMLLGTIALLSSGLANAGLMLFTDEVSFINAVGAHDLEDFEAVATGSYGTSATINDFYYDSTPSSQIAIADTPHTFGARNTTSGGSNYLLATASASFHDDMNISLASGDSLMAWGANFTDLDFGNINFLVDGVNQYNPAPAPNSAATFVGFLATGGDVFSQVTLSVNDNTYGIDDVRSKLAAVSVSEPNSIALLGLVLAGLGLSRKKKAA